MVPLLIFKKAFNIVFHLHNYIQQKPKLLLLVFALLLSWKIILPFFYEIWIQLIIN